VLGIGGGGDVAGALATAEHMRRYDGACPVVGGVSWERRPIDPVAGPRAADEIADARGLAPGVLLASARTRVRDREVYFAESRMAEFLGENTVLVDIHEGPLAIAAGVAEAADRLGSDLLVFLDVGGDVLAHGDEAGLRSPLCDAIMLAAAARLHAAGRAVLLAVFGAGCDAELSPEEVLERLGEVAAHGGLLGARGLTDAVAARVEAAVAMVPTEASAMALRAFRGERGVVRIRGGERSLQLSPLAAMTFFLDVPATVRSVGRLAQAVDDAGSLEEANEALHRLGVRTELDLEREAAEAARLQL